MPYKITSYTLKKARKLGLEIKPSSNKTKKLDVFRKDKKIASIGAYGMKDYPTYQIENGKRYANTRRRLYKIRHNRDRKKRWTRGWLSDQLLW